MPTAGPPQLRAVLLRMLVLAGVWTGLVGLLIAAGEIVTHSAALTHFDQHATRVVVSWRTPALDSAMKAVTWLGSWVAVLVTAVIIAVLVITGRLPVLAAIVAVLASAGEAGGVAIAKAVVGRRRPPRAIWLVHARGWSFPPATPPRPAWPWRSWRCASPRSPAAGRVDSGLADRRACRRGDRVLAGGTGGALDDRCDRQRLRDRLAHRDRDRARRASPARTSRGPDRGS